MLKNILNIEGLSVLDKKQQSMVKAGACSVFVRTENGNYWSAQTYSAEWAQEAYATGGDALYGGTGVSYSITGYCCSSCHTYSNHPSYRPDIREAYV